MSFSSLLLCTAELKLLLAALLILYTTIATLLLCDGCCCCSGGCCYYCEGGGGGERGRGDGVIGVMVVQQWMRVGEEEGDEQNIKEAILVFS